MSTSNQQGIPLSHNLLLNNRNFRYLSVQQCCESSPSGIVELVSVIGSPVAYLIETIIIYFESPVIIRYVNLIS